MASWGRFTDLLFAAEAGHGALTTIYILYVGLGYFLVADNPATDPIISSPGWAVIVSYVVCSLITGIVSTIILRWAVKDFLGKTDLESQYGSSSYHAYAFTFCVTLGAQMLLLGVHGGADALVWMVVFALITSGVAMGGTWIAVGYPGMYRIAGPLTLSASSLNSIGHELEILKVFIQSLVAMYVIIAIGMVVGIKDLKGLIPEGTPALIWFLFGVAIILLGLHFSVSGTVFRRYMSLVDLIRKVS